METLVDLVNTFNSNGVYADIRCFGGQRHFYLHLHKPGVGIWQMEIEFFKHKNGSEFYLYDCWFHSEKELVELIYNQISNIEFVDWFA